MRPSATFKLLRSFLISLGMGGSIFFSATPPALSGGFTQSQGDTFTSVTFRTFNSGSFEKLELQGYAEYGLTDDTTLILKVPFQWLEQNGLENQGFSDIEVGGRWRYFQGANISAAVQGILIIPPGYDPNASPALGGGEVGLELRLPVSQNYKLGNRPGYWTIEAAYRDYIGTRSDEFRVFAEVNQEIVKPISLAVQLDYINSLQNDLVFRPEDANITKLIGQVRWKVLDRTTLVLGGFTTVTGSDASGIEVQLWQSF